MQIQKLKGAYKALRDFDVNTCRISAQDNLDLIAKIRILKNATDIMNFYYSFFKTPFESDEVEKNQDLILSANWTYNGISCWGLAVAHMLNSVSFSIFSSEWNQNFILLRGNDKIIEVRHISSPAHIELHKIFFEEVKEIQLLPCFLAPKDKPIHLRDDHGKDKLLEFSKRLLKSNYICEIINSLPYNPRERKFIRKVSGNGLIEIVLPWTDLGLGIVVKTTGRNLRETQQIANIIQEQYGYVS